MACLNVTIEVEYTPSGTGGQDIEIGWRAQGDPTWNITTATGIGGAMGVFIQTVPCNTNCDGQLYELYIGNLCDLPGTTVYFEVMVADSTQPDCYEYQWDCVSVGIGSITPNPGSANYQSGDIVDFTGGGGSGASAIVDVVNGSGEILSYSILDPGTGYTSLPTLNVLSVLGTGATPVAVLADCPTLNHLDCTGITEPISIALGESYIECATQAIYAGKVAALTDDEKTAYEYNPIGTNCICNNDCNEFTINNTGIDSLTVVYNKCIDGALVVQEVPAAGSWSSPCEALCETISVLETDASYTISPACTACIP